MLHVQQPHRDGSGEVIDSSTNRMWLRGCRVRDHLKRHGKGQNRLGKKSSRMVRASRTHRNNPRSKRLTSLSRPEVLLSIDPFSLARSSVCILILHCSDFLVSIMCHIIHLALPQLHAHPFLILCPDHKACCVCHCLHPPGRFSPPPICRPFAVKSM